MSADILNAIYSAAELAFLDVLEREKEAFEASEENFFDRLDGNRRQYRLHNRQKLDLTTLDDELCESLFRFTLSEIKKIAIAMEFPEKISFRDSSPQRFYMDREYALAIMLRRLAYPSRYVDLELMFGIADSTICVIFNTMVVKIYLRFSEGIKLNRCHLHSFNLMRFNDAVRRKGSPYDQVVGFIDGSVHMIARPIENQETVYNGHYRRHGIKFQSIVTVVFVRNNKE